MNEEQSSVPPESTQIAPPVNAEINSTTSTSTPPQVMQGKNGIYMVSALGAFIVLLAISFVVFPKAKTEPVTAVNLPIVPESQYVPPPTYQPEIVEIVPTPEAAVAPMYPSAAMPIGATFGVPLVSATIAYDLTFDGVITNDDVRIIAQIIDQGGYSALVDFDSNGTVDVADLGLMRSVMMEYPVVFYDLTMDNMINKDDISLLASIIDRGQYVALFDFDANGKVDVGDLAMIRGGVSEAGTIGTVNY